MCQLGLSQSWLYALYDTLSICDGEQQVTTRKEAKTFNIKQNMINEINWIEKSDLTHDGDNWIYFIVMHSKYKCKNFTIFVSQQQFDIE